jgi:hypothetical protein
MVTTILSSAFFHTITLLFGLPPTTLTPHFVIATLVYRRHCKWMNFSRSQWERTKTAANQLHRAPIQLLRQSPSSTSDFVEVMQYRTISYGQRYILLATGACYAQWTCVRLLRSVFGRDRESHPKLTPQPLLSSKFQNFRHTSVADHVQLPSDFKDLADM